MSFELENDDRRLIRTEELASRMNVTRQTIHNWRNRGWIEPHEASTGRLLWDADECERRLEKTKAYKRHGGKRPRAGRRRQVPGVDAVTARAVHREDTRQQVEDLRDEVRRRVEERELPDDALHLVDVLYLSPSDLEVLSRLTPSEGGLRTVQMETLNTYLAYLDRRLRVDRERGDLVAKYSVQRAWTRQVQQWRRSIDGLPASLLPEIVSELGLAQDQVEPLRRILRKVTDRLLEEMAA